ncbi:helix-turn-helix domain-containing protein [Streptomyces sp. XY413]|uniref:helix-turn-helix domain-containing protein n=1 Tax=Streptomyces sp. XY413 TaxID=1519479 RepID=UPI00099B4498
MRTVPLTQPCAPLTSTLRTTLAVALRRRDANEPVTAIAERLGVGRSTLYRTLAAYDEAIATRKIT